MLNGLPPGLTSYATVWRETFKGENFSEFEVLWLFAKVFSTKFRGVVSFGGTIEQTEINFSTKISFPPIHENFLP